MGMRVVEGHGRAQPSLSGAGCQYHSLEQHLEGPVAAQDGNRVTQVQSSALCALQALPSLSTGK